MRVLFIAPYGGLGGSENVLVNVLERLDRERFEPHVLLLEQGPLRDRVAALGIPTLVQHMPGKQGVLKIPFAARRIPKRFDVIHANGGKAAVYALPLARRLKAPLVWMKHDHSYDGRLTPPLGRTAAPMWCAFRTRWPAQFEDMRERVSVVYPGVTHARPQAGRDDRPDRPERRPARSVQGLRPGPARDGAAARARAWSVDVRIAGPRDRVHTETEGELKRLADELGIGAENVGWVDDLDEVYRAGAGRRARQQAQGFDGAPGEGAPLVLMEAMGAARPVVGHRHCRASRR